MPTTNLFETATVVKKTEAKKKKAVPQLTFEGLEDYAFLDNLEKTIKTLKAEAREKLDPQAKAKLLEEGSKIGRQPENLKVAEGDASASYQLKKRSDASALSEMEQALCDQYGVETTVVGERFFFNPEYTQDMQVLTALNKALAPLIDKGQLPRGLIVKEEGKTVTTENSLNQVFRVPDEDARAQLLDVVGVLAVRPKIENTVDLLNKALQRVKDIQARKENEAQERNRRAFEELAGTKLKN